MRRVRPVASDDLTLPQEKYAARMRTRALGEAMSAGVAQTEAYLLPLLEEVTRYGTHADVFCVLSGLLWVYQEYRDLPRALALLPRFDALPSPDFRFDEGAIALKLLRLGAQWPIVMRYVRRGLRYAERRRPARDRPWDEYQIRSVQLALLARDRPESRSVRAVVRRLLEMRRGYRRYEQCLVQAITSLAESGAVGREVLPLLDGARAWLRIRSRAEGRQTPPDVAEELQRAFAAVRRRPPEGRSKPRSRAALP